MNGLTLYPLRFEPLYQYRLWGGRRLQELSRTPLPGTDPIGEAWILSDRDDHTSVVADGALAGQTIRELIQQDGEGMLGAECGQYQRFPLLLKFLDAREMLSVQVHPSDEQTELLPPGENGKTEAWVVLRSEPGCRIYAGLKPGTTAESLESAVQAGTVESCLASFAPKPGDGVFIEAGTVHALGGGVVVFEVQQNSDVTFRLFDWNRIDAKTGRTRELQVGPALASVSFPQSDVKAVQTVRDIVGSNSRERLFDCQYFRVWRHRGSSPMFLGQPGSARVIVCLEGHGEIESREQRYGVKTGDTYLVPAEVGPFVFSPFGESNILEIALPRTEVPTA